LEQGCVSENAVTTPFRGFDLVVQTFDKTAVQMTSEVIRDFVEPIIECGQE